MITLHMQMVEAAEEALNPRTQSRVWQETIKTQQRRNRMMEMRENCIGILMRLEMTPDDGIGDDAT